MAEDDDLEVFRRARPEPQEQQLQHALNRDVNNGQNHGTSGNTTRSPLFHADRINAPYRVFFGVLLVPFAQLDGYVTAKGLAQPYSAGWWIRGILMWVVVGFPFVASGWIVAKIASRTPLLPVLTFAVSVSTVMLIALILDDPRQALDLRMWLTVPLFLVVAPATTIAASGFVAARRR